MLAGDKFKYDCSEGTNEVTYKNTGNQYAGFQYFVSPYYPIISRELKRQVM